MMFDDIALTQKDLIDNLLNNLPAGYTKSKVKLPNAKFKTPTTKWLRTTLLNNTKQNVEAGGGYKRTFGFFIVDIFYPVGSGSKTQLEDVKLIQSLYENKQIGNAKCLEASIVDLDEEGSWYGKQVNIEFYYEGV